MGSVQAAEEEQCARVVVITGAGSGIGAAIALKFSEEENARSGLKLVLVDVNAESLVKVAQKCNEAAGIKEKEQIATVVGDVSVSEVRQEIVNATLSTFGKVDVLVNSAGVLIPGSPIPGLHPQDAQKMMDVNVQAACDLSLAFKDHLIANKGNIVNISSVAAFKPSFNRMYYCMSKAALDQATRCMAMNFGRHGVRVNSVSPGIVRTEIHSKRDDNGAIRDSDTNEMVRNSLTKQLE